MIDGAMLALLAELRVQRQLRRRQRLVLRRRPLGLRRSARRGAAGQFQRYVAHMALTIEHGQLQRQRAAEVGRQHAIERVGERIDMHPRRQRPTRSEEHTSELQSLMRNSYAVLCLKKKKNKQIIQIDNK